MAPPKKTSLPKGTMWKLNADGKTYSPWDGDVEVTVEKSATVNESGTSVSVGSSSTLVLALNANRREATFVNDSDEVMYLEKGSGATLNEGIRLNPNGGSYIETIYTGIFHAICSSGSKNLVVTET